MGIIAMKCPSCGANVEFDDNQEYGFCQFCRTKLMNENAVVKKISIENPVQIVGKVEVVNNEVEALIAQEELAIDYFLNKEHATYSEYQNISKLGTELERKAANDYRYYLLLCRFVTDVNFKAYKEKTVTNLPDTSIISIYDTGMNNAIKYCNDEAKREQIKEQYEKERPSVIERLNEYKNSEKKRIKKGIMWCCAIGIAIVVGSLIFALSYNT